MKIPHYIRADCREIKLPQCLVGAVCGLVLSIVSALLAENFFILYRILLLPRSAFPPLIFLMVQSLQFMLCGAIIAVLLTMCRRRNRRWRNAALLLVVTHLMLMIVWFPLVFGSLSFFIAFFIIAAAAALSFYSLRFMIKFNTVVTLAAALHFLWLVYLMWLTFAILLLN